MKSIKIIPILGALPEDTSWWSKEQWDSYEVYVAELKAEGRYLTEGDELTINYKEYPYFVENDNPKKDLFSNFGFMIPKGISDKNE